MKEKIILFFLLFTSIQFSQNVIVVVIDGARYTETFGGTGTYIPHMYNEMKPLGALYTDFKIDYNSGAKTETNPGHASILTGTWQTIANNGSQRPTYPTIFEYIRKENGNPQSDCYAVTGKDKLDILTYSIFSSYGSVYRGTWVGDDDRDDALTYSKVISVMQNNQPKILIINFAEVDAAGHSGNEVSYHNALINADNIVYQLWQHILAGDYGYTTSNTTLFITNDHGRHTTDFTGHGDGCEGCTHIMLLALGRNVTPGMVNNDPHYQIDLAPTIGDLLNFSTPQAIGTSLYAGSNPLPVEMYSFSASLIDNAIQLNWATETEVSNYGFQVQRSASNVQSFEWRNIGFVEGHGNSNSPKEYSFVDRNVTGGKYSYRLKQIDNDGKFEYSKVIEIDAGTPIEYELSQNYPNPFNPSTTIRFTIPEKGNVKLMIFNILGEEVATLLNEAKEAGVHTINFSAAELKSGIYFYKLESGNYLKVNKMNLIK